MLEDEGIRFDGLERDYVQKNIRMDLNIVAADSTLWRAILQMGKGNEIRGALYIKRLLSLF